MYQSFMDTILSFLYLKRHSSTRYHGSSAAPLPRNLFLLVYNYFLLVFSIFRWPYPHFVRHFRPVTDCNNDQKFIGYPMTRKTYTSRNYPITHGVIEAAKYIVLSSMIILQPAYEGLTITKSVRYTSYWKT